MERMKVRNFDGFTVLELSMYAEKTCVDITLMEDKICNDLGRLEMLIDLSSFNEDHNHIGCKTRFNLHRNQALELAKSIVKMVEKLDSEYGVKGW